MRIFHSRRRALVEAGIQGWALSVTKKGLALTWCLVEQLVTITPEPLF
jgi:hypothetical protein